VYLSVEMTRSMIKIMVVTVVVLIWSILVVSVYVLKDTLMTVVVVS